MAADSIAKISIPSNSIAPKKKKKKSHNLCSYMKTQKITSPTNILIVYKIPNHKVSRGKDVPL